MALEKIIVKKKISQLKLNNEYSLNKKQFVFFKYFCYSFSLLLKKKSILIAWFIYLFCVFCSLIIVPIYANINVLNVWSNSTFIFFQSLLNVLIAILTAILAINIIKISQNDTTELIITSKPISRVKMICCRFTLFFVASLLINISACLIALISFYVPSFDQRYLLDLFVSMLIGNCINFGIYGVIAILTTLFFNKNVIILINVLFNIILFIWQVITMFAIKIPILRAIDDNIIPKTITVMQRKKWSNNEFSGEYDTKKIVEFDFSYLDLNQIKLTLKTPNYQAIEQYWHNINESDLNKQLNSIEIGNQLTLAYNAYNLQPLLDKQAHQTFGISKFYDYNLTNPASPEIILPIANQSQQPLNWLYHGWEEADASGTKIIYPKTISFFGDSPSSVSNAIKK